MRGAAARYRELLIDLLLERRLNGGSLSDVDEAQRAAQLDRCWQFMAENEQEDAEAWWASSPVGPTQLASLDVKVSRGDQLLPRKAA